MGKVAGKDEPVSPVFESRLMLDGGAMDWAKLQAVLKNAGVRLAAVGPVESIHIGFKASRGREYGISWSHIVRVSVKPWPAGKRPKDSAEVDREARKLAKAQEEEQAELARKEAEREEAIARSMPSSLVAGALARGVGAIAAGESSEIAMARARAEARAGLDGIQKQADAPTPGDPAV